MILQLSKQFHLIKNLFHKLQIILCDLKQFSNGFETKIVLKEQLLLFTDLEMCD